MRQAKKTHNLRLFIVLWLPVLFYGALVFYMSSTPAPFGWQVDLGGHDKAAHLAEYAIFSALLLRALYLSDEKRRPLPNAVLTIGIALMYAALDELHQTVVPTRVASVHDFFYDAAGVFLVVIPAVALLFRIKSRLSRGDENRVTTDGSERGDYIPV